METPNKILVVRERPWESFLNDTMSFGWIIAASIIAGANAHWLIVAALVILWVLWMWAKFAIARAGICKVMTPAEAKRWLGREYPSPSADASAPWGDRTMGFAPPPRKG